MKRLKLSGTADTSGDVTTTGQAIFGKIYAILWNKGTCATGVDITVSVQNNDVANNLLVVANADASKYYYPRTLQHLDTSGADLTTHTEPIAVGYARLVIAQGGSGGAGSVTIFYDDD